MLSSAALMVRRHRVLATLAVVALVVGITATVYAVQENAGFAGSTAVGAHNWWQDIEGDAFCSNCHTAQGADLQQGPHSSEFLSSCTFCHNPGSDGHAAAPQMCVTCHSIQAGELSQDAHADLLNDVGETQATASKTCQSCHTHRVINITATQQPPVQLIMEP